MRCPQSSEPLEPSRKVQRLGSIVRAGQGEPGRFNQAVGQNPPLSQIPDTCCTGVCVAQLFREADARQIGMQSPSENPSTRGRDGEQEKRGAFRYRCRFDIWKCGEERGLEWKELGPQAALRKPQVVDAELQGGGTSSESPKGIETPQFQNIPCCTHEPGAPGHSAPKSPELTLLQLTGSSLWGCMLPSFPAPEALKRHTRGPISNHISLSINACCWKWRCMITLGEFDQLAWE